MLSGVNGWLHCVNSARWMQLRLRFLSTWLPLHRTMAPAHAFQISQRRHARAHNALESTTPGPRPLRSTKWQRSIRIRSHLIQRHAMGRWRPSQAHPLRGSKLPHSLPPQLSRLQCTPSHSMLLHHAPAMIRPVCPSPISIQQRNDT